VRSQAHPTQATHSHLDDSNKEAAPPALRSPLANKPPHLQNRVRTYQCNLLTNGPVAHVTTTKAFDVEPKHGPAFGAGKRIKFRGSETRSAR